MDEKKRDEGSGESASLLEKLLERNSLNRRLHWTAIASEKALLALIGLLTLVASFQALQFGVPTSNPHRLLNHLVWADGVWALEPRLRQLIIMIILRITSLRKDHSKEAY